MTWAGAMCCRAKRVAMRLFSWMDQRIKLDGEFAGAALAHGPASGNRGGHCRQCVKPHA